VQQIDAEHAEGLRGPRKPRRYDWLNADPKVFAFGVVDGDERCAGASGATRRVVVRVLRASA
jgi:hypothetical protein